MLCSCSYKHEEPNVISFAANEFIRVVEPIEFADYYTKDMRDDFIKNHITIEKDFELPFNNIKVYSVVLNMPIERDRIIYYNKKMNVFKDLKRDPQDYSAAPIRQSILDVFNSFLKEEPVINKNNILSVVQCLLSTYDQNAHTAIILNNFYELELSNPKSLPDEIKKRIKNPEIFTSESIVIIHFYCWVKDDGSLYEIELKYNGIKLQILSSENLGYYGPIPRNTDTKN